MTNIEELCSGCTIYEDHIKTSINNSTCIGFQVGDLHCPCQVCLIKVMCRKVCIPFKLKSKEWRTIT